MEVVAGVGRHGRKEAAWRSAARAAGGELLPGGAGGRIRAEGGRSRGELERRREEPSGGGGRGATKLEPTN